MESLSSLYHNDLLSNQNYIPLSFDYEKLVILKMLDFLPMTSIVMSCNRVITKKISTILGNELSIHTILYFRLPPGSTSIIHIDKNLDSPETFRSIFALNLPLMNCNKTLMNWYAKNSLDLDADTFVGPNGTSTPSISTDKVTCIDNTYYNKPVIVKINDWHSVENQSTTDVAQFISLRFVEPIEQVIKVFGEL